jgi:hypothetical protein
MKTKSLPNERTIREGRANLQRGIENVGGKLYLTSHRLIFEAHVLNTQRGPTGLSLDQISRVATCWTRFLGVVPIAPNSLAVSMRDATECPFVERREPVFKGR